MKKLLIALLALTTTAVQAYDLFADRCWELGGEALFWRPCSDQYEYGNAFNARTQTTSLGLQPGYDVGFRIWMATYKTDCCHTFDVDWTHLRTFDKERQGPATLFVFPNFAATGAEAHLKFAYDKVMIRAGRYIASHCNSMAWAYGGAGYLNLHRDRVALGFDANGNTVVKNVNRAGYEGGVLEVGVGADVEEPFCIHLVGQFTALVGIGQRTLTQTINELEFIHPGRTSCIAGVQMRLGVQWRYQCRCVWIMPQISYQLDHYFDALWNGTRDQANINASKTEVQSVGFSGPSVSLAVRF